MSATTNIEIRPHGSVRALARMANGERHVRRRPRTADDRAVITRMALLEVERRRAEGRLIRIGPCEYELRPRTATAPAARNATITS